jgi:hypothetical protein
MSDVFLSLARLQEKREALNRLDNGQKINNDSQAADFVNQRGFLLLMPVAGAPLPSLSAADEAEPWEGFNITDRAWNWKETLPEAKICSYTKLIRKRGTFIGWSLYPAFLKVYGPDGDADYEFENGRLGRMERDLYRLVEACGPIDSRELWSKAKSLFDGKRQRFTAALERLQARFFLTVSGGSLEGWTLHTWDTVERQAPPEVLKKLPQAETARDAILLQTVRNTVAVSERILRSILSWHPEDLKQCIARLKNEEVIKEVEVEGESSPCWTLFST